MLRGHIFEQIVCVDNLLLAWKEFSRGKRSKQDVQEFEFSLEDNLFQLHKELASGKYKVDPYKAFYINDPKLRLIHKASVRDRVLFQAVYRVLYPIFDKGFFCDSFASREGKGTHAGVNRLEKFLIKASGNNKKKVWALKCDVSKFFDSIDHNILLSLIRKKINDKQTLDLLRVIIGSFEKNSGKGLPLGNVTSQLFANIYLHELDFYVKQRVKIKYYLRYCDDFVILALDNDFEDLIAMIWDFLKSELRLELHPRKIEICSYWQGIDFLGYVLRPHHRTLRTKTKQRMLRRINEENATSYFGILRHCRGHEIEQEARRAL